MRGASRTRVAGAAEFGSRGAASVARVARRCVARAAAAVLAAALPLIAAAAPAAPAAPAAAAGAAAPPTVRAAAERPRGASVKPTSPVLVIHGGAGVMSRATMTPALEGEYRKGLDAALDAGWAVLEKGGSSLDAVEAAVRVLEDDPLFNAGRGAVFTWDGRNELDASLMDGPTRRAGAVTGVQHVRHPISLARKVMENSPHVLLSGAGAEDFALEQGIELVPRSWFHTERRWQQLQQAREGDRRAAAENAGFYFGTVGAVALDAQGRLAAATSTGGMTAKRWGRIGDSPLIGAGTWADSHVAVSATGDGELFIRSAVAHDLAARVQYAKAPVAEAARAVIGSVAALGGEGGVIAVDARGDVAMEFNSPGMFRGVRDARRDEVAIYRE